MRFLRMFLVALLALTLIMVALANRGMVTVSLFPGQFGQYLGGTWSLRMPLFLVIFLALLAGMLLGLVWEWLREAHLRQESRRRADQLTALEREVGGLRVTHAAPRDEVLAILDGPPRTAATAPVPATPAAHGPAIPMSPAAAQTLPAPR